MEQKELYASKTHTPPVNSTQSSNQPSSILQYNYELFPSILINRADSKVQRGQGTGGGMQLASSEEKSQHEDRDRR